MDIHQTELATGIHSLIAEERRISVDDNGIAYDYEYGKAIKIGNDVWIASNVIVAELRTLLIFYKNQFFFEISIKKLFHRK